MLQADSRKSVMVNSANCFTPCGVLVKARVYKGKNAVFVTMPPESYQDPLKEQLTDRTFLAALPVDFHNGTIEVDLAAKLAKDAPDYARGFIGLVFRADAKMNFEGIYLRPTNGRADDQVRRNHSAQYFSYPDFDFARLRKEAPERYESYVDIALNEWIHVKIEVHQEQARLFVNKAKQPCLIVKDLKHGSDQRGAVGLWIESGTVGIFRSHRVKRNG